MVAEAVTDAYWQVVDQSGNATDRDVTMEDVYQVTRTFPRYISTHKRTHTLH